MWYCKNSPQQLHISPDGFLKNVLMLFVLFMVFGQTLRLVEMKRIFKGLLTLHLLLNNNCIEEVQSITIVASRLAHERVHCLLDFFNFNINQIEIGFVAP